MGTHDVVILGGGPGGYVAAERLGAAALIEQELRIDDVKQPGCSAEAERREPCQRP